MAIKKSLNADAIQRFEAKFAIAPPHPCWEWMAAKNAKGYGVSKKIIARHRRERNIPSFASSTGKDGKFVAGMEHPRWR